MDRTRFHDILHGNGEVTPMIRTNQKPMVFPMKRFTKNDEPFSLGTIGFEEKDKVDILYDLSCNYFYLSHWEKEETLEQENIHLSDIYVGDSQEKDMYYTNPLLEEN